MVFNATFNNISVVSWWSDLLVEETGGSGENKFQMKNRKINISFMKMRPKIHIIYFIWFCMF
jgi:hypothetical protein